VTLYANGEAVAVNRYNTYDFTGGVAYLGKDILGSVRSVSNEWAQLEERYEYDAFGKPYKGDFSNGVGLGYTGKPYDTVTGMYNYGYRDYAPEVARFTTVDPIWDGRNWFAYVNNDPVNYVDLWGLQCPDASDKGKSLKGSGIIDVIVGVGLKVVNDLLGRGLTSNGPEIAKQGDKLISDGLFKIAVGDALIKGNTNTNGKDVIPIVSVDALPPNVQNAYNGYESTGWQGNFSGQTQGTRAGRTYNNGNNALPTTDSSGKSLTYQEFDVNNKVPGADRDAERFVRGSDNTVYYTDSHYGTAASPQGLPTFVEIK
jgi:RHS repeat-associated protein